MPAFGYWIFLLENSTLLAWAVQYADYTEEIRLPINKCPKHETKPSGDETSVLKFEEIGVPIYYHDSQVHSD